MTYSIGEQLNQSQKIKDLVNQLTTEVSLLNSQIKNVNPEVNERIEEYDKLIKKFGENRGRELYYPYIGTGAGNGCFVELKDGSVKLDLINGIGIHILGHSHPEMIKASIEGSLSDIVIQGNLQPNEDYGRISEELVKIASRKSKLKYAWITTSGSMANENALKACRQKVSPARKIIAFEAAFAGRTTMMAEITDNPGFKQGLPDYNEVLRLPFYNKKDPSSSEKTLSVLKKHLAENKNNICAFMFELMQGEGGYNSAPREFFVPLFEECKAAGVPIFADEVQTFCRTGEFFAFEKLDLGSYIDVCTVAKTLQVGATLYTEEFNPKPGLVAGTFSGSGSQLKTGLKVLEILSQGYMGKGGKIEKIHNEFVEMLNELNSTTCKGLLQDAGGLGLMVAVTPLDGSKEKQGELLKVLYKNGLIAFGCGRGPFRLRFLIPASISSHEIKIAKNIIEKSVLELS